MSSDDIEPAQDGIHGTDDSVTNNATLNYTNADVDVVGAAGPDFHDVMDSSLGTSLHPPLVSVLGSATVRGF